MESGLARPACGRRLLLRDGGQRIPGVCRRQRPLVRRSGLAPVRVVRVEVRIPRGCGRLKVPHVRRVRRPRRLCVLRGPHHLQNRLPRLVMMVRLRWPRRPPLSRAVSCTRQKGFDAARAQVSKVSWTRLFDACVNGLPGTVRAEGLEPSSSHEHRHLKPACLPKFHHARAPSILSPVAAPTCQRCGLIWPSTDEGFACAVCRGVRGCETPHRSWRKRLCNCASTRRAATDCAGLATPATDSATASERIGLRRRHDFSALPAAPYSYVLGLYLGDGCISRNQRVWRLRITLDAKYPGIIDRCRAAIEMLMPRQRASIHPQRTGCVVVSLYSKHWPCLLPQHGPGRKHLRSIRLEPWQEALVDQATQEFIRGLFDSDGCRVVANDRGVRSVRYHFSNRSEDILGLFAGALDDLGIPWTRSSRHIISIYRKAAVARLDEFVGPKA